MIRGNLDRQGHRSAEVILPGTVELKQKMAIQRAGHRDTECPVSGFPESGYPDNRELDFQRSSSGLAPSAN